jgi:hypothetical protein
VNRYKLEQGPDGITWVSIQPLMADVAENLDKLKNIVYDGADKHEIDMRILGLTAIYEFLGALVTEKKLEQLRVEHYGEKANSRTIQ